MRIILILVLIIVICSGQIYLSYSPLIKSIGDDIQIGIDNNKEYGIGLKNRMRLVYAFYGKGIKFDDKFRFGGFMGNGLGYLYDRGKFGNFTNICTFIGYWKIDIVMGNSFIIFADNTYLRYLSQNEIGIRIYF